MRAQAAAQLDRWMLGAPVALGGGAATYFALKSEPAVWPLAALCAAAVLIWLAARRWSPSRVLILAALYVALALVGGLAAKVRTMRVATPRWF